jgi:AbrB family looped-hinge helix DNA binding protein
VTFGRTSKVVTFPLRNALPHRFLWTILPLTTHHARSTFVARYSDIQIFWEGIMFDTTKVGKHGTVVIPAALRRRFGLEEGSLVVVEVRDEGILIRPAVAMPVEIYTPERRAEFLLSTAVDAADYAGAVEEVRKMGLDPATIPHQPPPGA